MICAQCGTENPDTFRFCGNCGAKQAPVPATGPSTGGAKTVFFGDMQAPNRAKLVLIKGEGMDGIAYHLQADEHTAGRLEGEIRFPDDPLLSPRHACFYYDQQTLTVRDEGSANGVFVRIKRPIPLQAGSRFLVGEQLIEFADAAQQSDADADGEGTYFYASPPRAATFRLIQRLRGGQTGTIFRSVAERVSMGREGNDINFPDDPFISGQHAEVSSSNGEATLTDMGSKNGTFIRIDEPTALAHGDYVFLGQQLLRVEIS